MNELWQPVVDESGLSEGLSGVVRSHQKTHLSEGRNKGLSEMMIQMIQYLAISITVSKVTSETTATIE